MTPAPTEAPPQPETETIDPATLPREDVGFWLFLEEIPVFGEHDTGGPLTPPPAPPPARSRRYWGGSGNSGFWRAIIWLVFILLALAAGGLIGEVANRVLKTREG